MFEVNSITFNTSNAVLPITLDSGTLALDGRQNLSGQDFTGELEITDGTSTFTLDLTSVKVSLDRPAVGSNSGKIEGTITSSNDLNGANFVLTYSRGAKSPKLTITSAKHGELQYDYSAGKFVGYAPVVAPILDNAVSCAVVANDQSGASVLSLEASANNGRITVVVGPNLSPNDPNPLFAFYLTDSATESDGMLLAILEAAEMTKLADGRLSCEFDLSNLGLADNTLYLYAFNYATEDESDAVRSDAFEFIAPTAEISCSQTSLDFGAVPIGQFETREFTIANTSDVTAFFAIDAPDSETSDYYVYLVDAQGEPSEVPYVELPAGRSP